MKSPFCRVITFVDWDSAFRIFPGRGKRAPSREKKQDILEALDLLTKEISHYLMKQSERNESYRVMWRVYHGWYRGKTKMPERREFEGAIAEFSSRAIGKKIAITNDFKYGDEPLCDTKRKPLYDTLRGGQGRIDSQKMVDTALICDLLHAIRYNEADIGIVIGDDDDLIPGLITAEAWKGRVAMLHRRTTTNPHLNTKGLLYAMR